MPERLKGHCVLKGGTCFPEALQGRQEGELPFIKVSDMSLRDNSKFINSANNYIESETASRIGATVFPENSTVFAKVGAALLLNRRRLLACPTVIDNNMMAAVPTSADATFLYHFLCSVDFGNYVQTGALPSVNQSTLGEIPFPAFCIEQQRRVAEILDAADHVIEQTAALIEKHHQIRNGLTQDLFGRGVMLDGGLRPALADTPERYKSSPCGWIPSEWGISEFGQLAASAKLGTTKRGVLDGTDDIPLLKMGNLDWGGLRLEDVEKVSKRRVPEWKSLLLRDGDLLFNTRNTPDLVGKTSAWRGQLSRAICDNNILRVRFDERVNGVFLALWMGLGPGRRLIGQLSTGTTSVAAVYWRNLRRLPVPVPSRVEQDAIVARIDSTEGPIRLLQSEHTKLQQLKRGLRRDLLTGRVPVPVENAPEPKEVAANV